MRRDEATLLDIAQAARRIVFFVQGVDEASFAANVEKHWAVVAQLLGIGEAVTRLSHEFRNAHPEIEWAKIAAMRNRLIHGYDKIGGTWYGGQRRRLFRNRWPRLNHCFPRRNPNAVQ